MISPSATRGFVFKKQDLAEADRVFSVFTEDLGRVDVFAKAIKKISSKLKSGIDVFSFVNIEFVQGKNRKTLTDSLILQKFGRIISSPKRFEIANRVSIAIDEFINGAAKDGELMALLQETFEILDSEKLKSRHCDLLYYYFLWNFFCVLGSGPELSKCSRCQQSLDPARICFSCKEGGAVCAECGQGQRISPDIIKILRIITKRDWQTTSKIKIGDGPEKQLQNLSQNYYFYLADK